MDTAVASKTFPLCQKLILILSQDTCWKPSLNGIKTRRHARPPTRVLGASLQCEVFLVDLVLEGQHQQALRACLSQFLRDCLSQALPAA